MKAGPPPKPPGLNRSLSVAKRKSFINSFKLSKKKMIWFLQKHYFFAANNDFYMYSIQINIPNVAQNLKSHEFKLTHQYLYQIWNSLLN